MSVFLSNMFPRLAYLCKIVKNKLPKIAITNVKQVGCQFKANHAYYAGQYFLFDKIVFYYIFSY